jgi:hypothetical protein
MMVNDVLAHFGIPGMKWGRRKARGSTVKSRVVRKPPSPGELPVKKSKLRTGDMSDDDLRKAIGRIQMEKQYAQLTAKEKSVGRKLAEEVLLGAGKQVATTYAAKYMGQGVEALLKKK